MKRYTLIGILATAVLFVLPLTVAVVSTDTAVVHERPCANEPNLPDLIDQVRPAVVHIAKLGVCQGSGFIIDATGIIVTAKHVSDSAPADYTVTLDNGDTYPVKYVLEDRENDCTFMQLEGHNAPFSYLPISQGSDPRPGTLVVIAGSPLGYDNFNTFSTGIVSAVGRDLYHRKGWGQEKRYDWHVMLQTTSPAFPGNSGGAVLNMRGEVIGILVAGQAETLNFAVPASRFRTAVQAAKEWMRLARLRVVQPDDSPEPQPMFEPYRHGDY
jgi:S1-C subfamily serine protease